MKLFPSLTLQFGMLLYMYTIYNIFVISDAPITLDLNYNDTQKLPYVWAKDKPLLYIQQIIIKIGNLHLYNAKIAICNPKLYCTNHSLKSFEHC